MRKNLLSWQWSDYFNKHRDQRNLVIHLFAVPLFWIGIIDCFYWRPLLGLFFILVSFMLQGIGHRFEKEKPTAFEGPSDFISRFLVEQFVTFPRFIFSGNLKKSFFSDEN